MPTTHTSTMYHKCLALIDSIFNLRYINIGCLITTKIYKCVESRSNHLFYQCLITELCHRASVQVLPNDLIMPMRQGWICSKILNIMFITIVVPELFTEPEVIDFDGPPPIEPPMQKKSRPNSSPIIVCNHQKNRSETTIIHEVHA